MCKDIDFDTWFNDNKKTEKLNAEYLQYFILTDDEDIGNTLSFEDWSNLYFIETMGKGV